MSSERDLETTNAETKAQICLPAWATSQEQIKAAYDLLEKARDNGYRTGIMLVLGTPSNLEVQATQKILDNLNFLVGLPTPKQPGVFLMHPFGPLSGDKVFNLASESQFSIDYLGKSFELAARIPEALSPKKGKVVTAHINAHLVILPDDQKSQDRLMRAQEETLGTIRTIVDTANHSRVRISFETMPLPEFGDRERTEKTLLNDGVHHWADLVNALPLFLWRPREIQKLRDTGAELTIDLGHSFIAQYALKELAELPPERIRGFMRRYGLTDEDIKLARRLNFANAVLLNTQPGDIWHVSQPKGTYHEKPTHGDDRTYLEGLSLHQKGDIHPRTMAKLIKAGLASDILFTLEIIERSGDYVGRPETSKSLKKIASFFQNS